VGNLCISLSLSISLFLVLFDNAIEVTFEGVFWQRGWSAGLFDVVK
jgi:hypothetical protein